MYTEINTGVWYINKNLINLHVCMRWKLVIRAKTVHLASDHKAKKKGKLGQEQMYEIQANMIGFFKLFFSKFLRVEINGGDHKERFTL